MHKVTGDEAVEVDAAGNCSSSIIFRRPRKLLAAFAHVPVCDGGDQLTLDIEYR